MKKKLLALLLVLSVCLTLASCMQVETESYLLLTDLSGRGARVFTFYIPKDRETVVDENGTYSIYNNSTYFPQGLEAFMEWTLARMPEGDFTYSIDETNEPEYTLVHVSYTFSSFEEYVQKTRLLVGEERWTKAKYIDPQCFVYEVADPSDEHYGMTAVTYAESHFIAKACMNSMLEFALCKEAVDAGVYAPYGDSFENPDCRAQYEVYEGAKNFGSFEEFAGYYFYGNDTMAVDSPMCYFEIASADGEVFFEDKISTDCLMTVYVENGTYPLTDVTPFLPEGKTEGFFWCDGEHMNVLTPKEGEEQEEWIKNYDAKKISLGHKPLDFRDPLEEETPSASASASPASAAKPLVTAPKNTAGTFVFIGALAAAIVSIFVSVLCVARKKN